MKGIFGSQLSFVAAITAAVVLSTSAQDLTDKSQKESYAVGADLARNLKRQGIDFNTEALLKGMQDVLSGKKLVMGEDDMRQILRDLQLEQRKKALIVRRAPAVLADENAQRGAAFLEQNKTNSGVVSLPSGLQYQVLKTGTGAKPKDTDTVECQFRGTLITGQEFAASNPAQPATFKMSEVIAGWKEALAMMSVGSKWRLFIPPQLAFGEQGVGRARLAPRIGPNATVIYEVELLGIVTETAQLASKPTAAGHE